MRVRCRLRRLVLVKHSMPDVEPERPASTWSLGDVGRQRAEMLAVRLTGCSPNMIWTSKEPKAVETADTIARGFGVPVQVADGLEEHHRTGGPFLPTQGEFEAAIERFFCEPDWLVFGTETANEALHRFSSAIELVVGGVRTDTCVITHGTVMTIFVARLAGVQHMNFWRRLGLPSFVVLTLPEMQVSEVVESVDSE